MEEYVRVCKFGRGFWTSMRSSPENVEVCSCYPSYALNYLRKRIFVNLDEIYVLPSPDADAEGGDKMGWSGGVGVDDLECVARFEDLEEGEMRCGKCLPTWLERKRAVVEEGRKRGDAEFVGR